MVNGLDKVFYIGTHGLLYEVYGLDNFAYYLEFYIFYLLPYALL